MQQPGGTSFPGAPFALLLPRYTSGCRAAPPMAVGRWGPFHSPCSSPSPIDLLRGMRLHLPGSCGRPLWEGDHNGTPLNSVPGAGASLDFPLVTSLVTLLEAQSISMKPSSPQSLHQKIPIVPSSVFSTGHPATSVPAVTCAHAASPPPSSSEVCLMNCCLRRSIRGNVS